MSNVFSCVGTVGRDAEVRYLPSGQAVLNVNIANNIGFGEKEHTLWIRVALWGKKAEGNLKNYLVKGQQVFVSGELTTSEYRANDGTMRTTLELNANIVNLVGSKKVDAGSQAQPQPSYPPASNKAPTSAPVQQGGGTDNFDAPYDDDIPF